MSAAPKFLPTDGRIAALEVAVRALQAEVADLVADKQARAAGRARTRAYRARQGQHQRVFRVTGDEVELAAMLEAGGFLEANLADDPKEIEAALQRWVAAGIAAVTRHGTR
jgi:hypothetical protein